jgi:hypothetical protein
VKDFGVGRSQPDEEVSVLHWQPPPELPDLRSVSIIALDLETKDEGLLAERGSGWPWGGGYICGVSIAYHADGEIRAHYFPLRHPDTDNFDASRVYDWLKDLVASGVRFVTQNGLYDWGWLRSEAGIRRHPRGWRRSARSPLSLTRTAIATASTPSVLGAAFPARMRRC